MEISYAPAGESRHQLISFESILEVFGQFEMCLIFDQVLQEADPEMRFVCQ